MDEPNQIIDLATPQPSKPAPTDLQEVKIVDVNMPFWHLALFLVKFALAAIPATIIFAVTLIVIGLVASAVLAAFSIGATSFIRASRDPLLLATPTTGAPVVITPYIVPEATSTLAPTISPDSYDLVLIRVDGQDTDAGYTVTGTLTNRGAGPSPAVVVVTTFEDRTTGAVRTQEATLGRIDPDKTIGFSLTNPDPGDWAYTIDLKSAGADRQPLEYRDVAP